MKNRILRSCRTMAVIILCLAAATPAWAGYGVTWQKLDVYLKGVNRYGCLTYYGGSCASFCALINTCTGDFVGTTSGNVCNESKRFQFFTNVNLFNNYAPVSVASTSQSGYYGYVCVKFSLYTVTDCGWANYVALGKLSQSD